VGLVDLVVRIILVVLTIVYQPGNENINAYCKHAVEEAEEFTNRKECWDYYKDYRDEIPSGEY